MRSEEYPPLYALFHIGNSIHLLNRRSERQLGLSLVQWHLLNRLIDMPGCSPLALAAAVGVSAGTLTQTMRRLERKGLLFLAEDPKDSRKKLVAITREGKRALESASAEIQEWAKEIAPFHREISRIRSCLQSQLEREI
jgi:DNA-binding MarR family transcriptional regulator